MDTVEQLYRHILPLSRSRHQNLRLPPLPALTLPPLAGHVPLTAGEVARLGQYWPVAFVSRGALPVPMAILDDRPIEAEMLPLYLRRWPFILGRPGADGRPRLCIDAAWAGTEAPDAAPLFASDGQPTARLRELAGVAERYHREAVATASRCADLAAAGVLAPAPMRAAMPGSAALWLDRERLKRLAPAALRQLIDGGALELAFPALWSLEALAPSGTDARRYRAWLIQQVQGLGVRYGVEDSLQIGAGGITVDRFLVSLPKSALGDAAHARLLHLCRGLAMPPALLRRYQSCLPDADHCYFGWECRDGRVRLKAYLEYFQRWRAEKPVAPGPGRDVLMVLGFKWQADAPAQYGVTRYRWHPELSAAQVRGRALDLMTAGRGGPLADVCRHLLDAALDPAVPADDETGSGTALRFLEVTDDGSDRHSFDINLYRRGRRVADIEQSLRGLAAALGLAEQDLAADLAAIRGDSLGHVSGGRNRHGQPFVTVYHGMRFGSGPDGPVPRSPA